MSEDKKFLEVKNLKVEYTSEGKIVHAVNGVTFHLDRGRTVGLVGETGAGKTSIAKAILRILPNPGGKISDGEVYLEGEDILKRSERGMRKLRGRKISMIFQDPMTSLNPVKKVVDQIAEVIKTHNKKMSMAEATAEAIKMLGKGRNCGKQGKRVPTSVFRWNETKSSYSDGISMQSGFTFSR